MTHSDRLLEHRKPLSQMRLSILRLVIALLAAIPWNGVVTEVHVEFSSRGNSMELIRFFVNIGARGMLEGKDYRAV